MKSFRTILLAALALMAAGCSSQPGSTPTPHDAARPTAARRFVFVSNGDDPFWDALNAGLMEGAKRSALAEKGFQVAMEKGNGTPQGQIEKLRQLGSQADVAGIAISVIQGDNAAIVDEMKKLAAKGVKVITVDGDVNRDTFRDARPFYIGTDNVVAGRLLGLAAKAILAARGKTAGGYAQFTGYTDNDNARARMNGFQEAMGAAFAEADRMSDQMDLARARDNVRTALINHPELVALVGIWAYNAPAIVEVVEERNARDRITTVTFDAQAVAIERMAEGKIDAMVVQDPFGMGIQTVRLLLAMQTGDEATIGEMFPRRGEPDGDLHTTGLRLIVPDKDPLVTPQDAAAIPHEYTPLSTFREWLGAHGLSSS